MSTGRALCRLVQATILACGIDGVAQAGLPEYQAAVQSEPSLISQYTFDRSDLTDTSGAHGGNPEGRVSFTTGIGGAGDKAVLLSGDGHVRLHRVPDFEFVGGTGTIEAWLRADWSSPTSVEYSPCPLANNDLGLTNWIIQVSKDRRLVCTEFWIADASGCGEMISDGKWHHLAVVFGGKRVTLYVDGTDQGSSAMALGKYSGLPTQLGSSSDVETLNGWVGGIDEVAFYSASLPAEAVLAHYLAMTRPDRIPFLRGDANGDRTIDLADAISILGNLFLGEPARLDCEDSADTDDNGRLEVSDAVYLMGFQFLGGPAPRPPFPVCGTDPTPQDPLTCESSLGCR